MFVYTVRCEMIINEKSTLVEFVQVQGGALPDSRLAQYTNREARERATLRRVFLYGSSPQ